MTSKNIKRAALVLVLTVSVITSFLLILEAYKKQQWETIAASLAVITAVFATWTSLSIVWRQEDDLEPDIILCFDLDSRSRCIQLLIRNVGGQNAYDIKIKWEKPLLNYVNEEVNFPIIPVLLKGEIYRLFVGTSVETFEKAKKDNSELNFAGCVLYKVAKDKKKYTTKEFDLSLEGYRKKLRPISDEQNFYLKNTSIANELGEIKDLIKEFVNCKKSD